jgi:polyhydroxybutyrate depolymerase
MLASFGEALAHADATQTGGTPVQPVPSGVCAQTGAAHDVTVSIKSEGQARSAVLHLPATAGGRPLALLVAFHGWGSNGARFERETGFDSLANSRGFAVLYPSSAGGHWLISGPRTDVNFVTALLTRVESVACIDRSRVYATGVSNGAGMVARLACEASLEFAGAVPVAGYYSPQPPCEPARPVSVLEVHGTDDQVVPYHDKKAYDGSDALALAAAWAARDGCEASPTKVAFAPHAALYRWNGCAGGARVEQLTLYGDGHGLPDAPGALVHAPGPSNISGVGIVWSFLAPIVLSTPPS